MNNPSIPKTAVIQSLRFSASFYFSALSFSIFMSFISASFSIFMSFISASFSKDCFSISFSVFMSFISASFYFSIFMNFISASFYFSKDCIILLKMISCSLENISYILGTSALLPLTPLCSPGAIGGTFSIFVVCVCCTFWFWSLGILPFYGGLHHRHKSTSTCHC